MVKPLVSKTRTGGSSPSTPAAIFAQICDLGAKLSIPNECEGIRFSNRSVTRLFFVPKQK